MSGGYAWQVADMAATCQTLGLPGAGVGDHPYGCVQPAAAQPILGVPASDGRRPGRGSPSPAHAAVSG
jgi:hypothetical protein